jgi:nitric oxide reductase NorD protein
MTVRLDDYAQLLGGLPEDAEEVLRREWPQAARAFSSSGLERYIAGASALARLGRGSDLVKTFLEEAPAIAQEIGEDAVDELVASVMTMASRTSGAVLLQLVGAAPHAAQRLGDAELFRGLLQLLSHLLAHAPRGVRPMLEKLEVLLAQLTLGGLKRWARRGVHMTRSDPAAQARYFGLESRDAHAVLQEERRGVLFVDVQRRIRLYLRALWGHDFLLRPTSGELETPGGCRPFVAEHFIHLPDAYDTLGEVSGVELYRAAAAHCAAHVVYTRAPIDATGLGPLERTAAALIEDARVEALASDAFPGLLPLWSRLHARDRPGAGVMGACLDRVARALIDASVTDAAPFVAQARARFDAARAAGRLRDPMLARELGIRLAGDLERATDAAFNARVDLPSAPYRDDNRIVWEVEAVDLGAARAATRQSRRHVSLMELVNAVEVEGAADDAQEIWVLGSELYDDDGRSYNAREGRPPVAEPVHYPEWDYQIQLERPLWTSVIEQRPAIGSLELIARIASEHRQVTARIKHLLDALQPQGVQRIRRLEDGDEIDLNAAIDALTDLRLGNAPDPRVMMRSVLRRRDIAVLVLLDLSQSANDRVAGRAYSVLDLTRAATVLLGEAIHRVGDAFALHGFCSNGRHDVSYLRFKDFAQGYDDLVRARLAAMSAQGSTRMGAAIRHAGAQLKRTSAAKKLLLVLTDGEPADVDVRDPQYLRFDCKKAVEDVARAGIHSFCISLDPRADPYVSRIFGARGYAIIDHVERLPEKLPLLYAGLTR